MSELYTPAIVQSTEQMALLAFSLRECPTCKKPMIIAPAKSLRDCQSIWGSAHNGGNTIDAQCSRAGFVLESNVTNKENETICEECAKGGLSTIVCACCKKERSNTDIEDSFGDPPEYLCKQCYESVPAKTWNNLVDKLNEAHRYDFE